MNALQARVFAKLATGKLVQVSTFADADVKKNLQSALDTARADNTALVLVDTDAQNVNAINQALQNVMYDLKPTKAKDCFVLGRIKGSGMKRAEGIIAPETVIGIR